ncbi:DUF4150 domain-containing protein [Pragia fontium]|uniref:Tox-PAAR-like domain-containing protein n=2 Tax=Pragia fontium TaxID=82985 RepID=A0AAJ4W8P7_9GAMM|nr:DUF4150 domain-containing protein [Pragia fontium]GKX63160.1 hypothetical protein SOASR032_17290 [Pragia fontium]SFC31456.1 protein of unknown function [Pragia fontium DSM 5563 = ATCC 49100]VEJ54418.1 Uncharacterised protein [Pragia fontium]
MAKNLIARKNGTWLVVCIFPDVCKTPIGPSMVPIPYPVMTYLSNSKSIVPSVRVNGDPILVHSKSFVSITIGDQPGIGRGLKKAKVSGKCRPDQRSDTVKAKKKKILRHGDKFHMNG